jgi:hypothetical protein
MKAITAVTLQMKTTLSEAEAVIRHAEGLKTPKTRRALISDNYVKKKYFDTKFDELLSNLKNQPKLDDAAADSSIL